jgi:hypothetical protein
MKRTSWLLSLILALLVVTMPLRAQEDKPKVDNSKQSESARPAPRAPNWYKVDLTVSEFEDGKKMNTRHYTVHVDDIGDRSNTKFGTRVPVSNHGSTSDFSYIDVGLNITMRIVGERGEHNILETGFELSSFAIPEQAKQTVPGVPILRQVQTSNSLPVASVSKPIVVASLDDPNSTKRYQFEIVLTKL